MSAETQAPTTVKVVTVEVELAVVFPRETLAEQGIAEGAELFVSVQSKRIVLSRRSPSELLQLSRPAISARRSSPTG